jgi:hypothetical protein
MGERGRGLLCHGLKIGLNGRVFTEDLKNSSSPSET